MTQNTLTTEASESTEAAGYEAGRGIRFDHNPFVQIASCHTISGVRKLTNKSGAMMVINNQEGETSETPAGFWHAQEVDKTQFVKLYINGVKAFKELSGAGTKVFEILYLKIQDNIGKDQLLLTYSSIDQEKTKISRTTFFRGVRELVEKSFIAETMTLGVFYLNPDYLWNGDRLAFVKEFRKKELAMPVSKLLRNKKS